MKLNAYELKDTLASTFQMLGIIPGSGTAFETVRVSNAAFVAFIQQYAGEDGTDGKQVEMRKGSTAIEWRYVGDLTWNALVPLTELMVKGDAGEQVMLQKTATAIQWKYSSAVTWTDLVLLTDIRGANGTNGRTMWTASGAPSTALGVDGDFANDVGNSVMYGPKTANAWGPGTSYKGVKGDTGTGLKNRGAWVTGTVYAPGDYVFSTGSATTSSMWILNGEVNYTSSTLPKDDLTHWVEFVAPAGADGVDGKNVEMRKTATVIQWRLVGNTDWIDLVTIADLKGADGTNGKTLLTTSGVPSAGTGVNGDYAIDPLAQILYGPKAAGAWPAGVSYKGTDGAPGTPGTPGLPGEPGTPGVAGSKWYTSTTVPDAGTGVNGDFYLRSNGDYYGPKAAGAWGSVVASLKGTKGDTGPGVPVGGTTGQVLVKLSATDLDVGWATPSSGGGGTGDVTKAGDNVFTGKNYFGTKPTSPAPPADPSGLLLAAWGPALFAGSTEFRILANFAAGFKMPSIVDATPSAGVAALAAYNLQQRVAITATAATLTLKLPDASGNTSGSTYEVIPSGTIFRIFFPFDVTALTVTPGKNTYWYSDAVLRGAPTSFKAGIMEIQYFSTGDWYFLHG